MLLGCSCFFCDAAGHVTPLRLACQALTEWSMLRSAAVAVCSI